MKKNLTFLMMLMAFVGVLSAQSGPKFNFQAAVRHADTLYHNNPVDIQVVIMDAQEHPVLIESHDNVMTTDNGFVSIVIGEGNAGAVVSRDVIGEAGQEFETLTPVNNGDGTQIIDGTQNSDNTPANGLSSIDWNGAMIEVTFYFAAEGYETVQPVTVFMPVTPVPFALQANAASITTEAIVEYLTNVPANEAKQVLDALVMDNHDLQEQIEDAIEEYLTSQYGYQIALQLAAYYMNQNLTPEEAKEYYDALKANTNITNEIKVLVKNFVMNANNRAKVKGWVKPVVLYCLGQTTVQDVKDVYHALQAIPASEKQEIKAVVKAYLQAYVQSEDFEALITANQTEIVADVNDIVRSISKEEALAAWAWLGMYNSDVKTVLRNKLNEYIDGYQLNLNVNTGNLIETPEDCTIDYCELKGLFEYWSSTHGN